MANRTPAQLLERYISLLESYISAACTEAVAAHKVAEYEEGLFDKDECYDEWKACLKESIRATARARMKAYLALGLGRPPRFL